jgi:hypothetical protein
MCQANVKSIDMNNLEIMFNVNSSSQQTTNSSSMKTERILQGKSVSNILISLYGPLVILLLFYFNRNYFGFYK